MEEAAGGGEAGDQNRIRIDMTGRTHRFNGASALFVYRVRFFFLGPLGLDVGCFLAPLRKWVVSYRSKKNNNPNPSPTGNGFGLYGFVFHGQVGERILPYSATKLIMTRMHQYCNLPCIFCANGTLCSYKKEAPAVGAYCPVQGLRYLYYIKQAI